MVSMSSEGPSEVFLTPVKISEKGIVRLPCGDTVWIDALVDRQRGERVTGRRSVRDVATQSPSNLDLRAANRSASIH